MDQLDQNIVKLYKFSKSNNQELPAPYVHVYLASILQHQVFTQPRDAHTSVVGIALPQYQGWIVHSKEEMLDVIKKHRFEPAHSVAYVTSRLSAEFHFSLNATLHPMMRDYGFTHFCYDLAAHYSRRLQRKGEFITLEQVASETKRHVDFISAYHISGRNQILTPEDYESLADHVFSKAKAEIRDNQKAFMDEIHSLKERNLLN